MAFDRRIPNGTAVDNVVDCRHLFVATGTDQRINVEYSGHSTAPVAMIQPGFVVRNIIKHMDVAFEESFGDRLRRETRS